MIQVFKDSLLADHEETLDSLPIRDPIRPLQTARRLFGSYHRQELGREPVAEIKEKRLMVVSCAPLKEKAFLISLTLYLDRIGTVPATLSMTPPTLTFE